MGNIQKAWEEIRKAVELMPEDPIIWEHYGDIARELGFMEEARRGYRSSLEIKPENPEVRQKLEAL
jgi:Flp pilus assembly protein TadD